VETLIDKSSAVLRALLWPDAGVLRLLARQIHVALTYSTSWLYPLANRDLREARPRVSGALIGLMVPLVTASCFPWSFDIRKAPI